MSTSAPTIQPDDGSPLTPDVPASALASHPEQPEPDVSRLKTLLGERVDARHVSLVGLFILAILYTLHFAASLVLPIVLAILLDFTLSPVVRWLKRFRIPPPLGAALVLLTLVGAATFAAYRLSGPAANWITRAPESFANLRERLESVRGPMQQVTEAAEEAQQAARIVDGPGPTQVEVKGPSLVRQIFGGTAAFATGALVVLFLTYFLLAASDLFLTKLVTVLPQFQDKKKAVLIARETEAQISVYLLTTTLINLGVGVVTGIVLYLLGMPNPVLWGAVAAVLNFVPYLGAVVNCIILALAALLTFESPARALAVPASFLALNLVESNLVTPWLLGRRMRLNTVALFVGLVFWGYLWGVTGAILAVPIMAALKIMCDHIESLAPVGEFLGE